MLLVINVSDFGPLTCMDNNTEVEARPAFPGLEIRKDSTHLFYVLRKRSGDSVWQRSTWRYLEDVATSRSWAHFLFQISGTERYPAQYLTDMEQEQETNFWVTTFFLFLEVFVTKHLPHSSPYNQFIVSTCQALFYASCLCFLATESMKPVFDLIEVNSTVVVGIKPKTLHLLEITPVTELHLQPFKI